MKKGTTPARTGWAWRMAACVAGGRAGGHPPNPRRDSSQTAGGRENGGTPKKKRDAPLKRRHPRETRKIKIVIMRHVGIPWGVWMMKGERVTRWYRMRSTPRCARLELRTHH